MPHFTPDRWVMSVQFDSIRVTMDAKAYEGGMGEAAEFYAYVRNFVDNGDPDQVDRDTALEAETVMLTVNLFDHLQAPLVWLFANAVPKKVTIRRTADRGDR